MRRTGSFELGVAAFALVLCAIGPGRAAAADPSAAVVKQLRQYIDQELQRLHVSAESIDRDGLVRELEKRAQAGESPTLLGKWLQEEMQARWLGFAPIAPPYKEGAQFHLPHDNRVNWIVTQGVSGQASHTGRNEFAFDFVMPEGTPILAVRKGTVARVVDGFTRCCLPKERSYEANTVTVLHPNGTFSSYAHLRPGIPVKEGQEVRSGELLGYSGSTGYANMPHLHFEVSIRDKSGQPQSIPIRFMNGTPEGYVPTAWRLYQNRPPDTVRLGVTVDGHEAVSGEPLPIERRPFVPLRVLLASPSGRAIDVTNHPGTRYVALTPWSLRTDRAGRVHFGFQSSQWKPLPEMVRTSIAILTILFEGSNGRRGSFDLWFRFSDVEERFGKQPAGPSASSPAPE
jgi:murein DD-endopeptidase MepM/ murein hydrolase activator NlpD